MVFFWGGGGWGLGGGLLRTLPRQVVAKLRSGYHNLRTESGRHCKPKLPGTIRICQYCFSNQIENESHFLLHVIAIKTSDNKFTKDILNKYPIYDLLNDNDKIVYSFFLFNNVDTYICRKLVFETQK